MSKQMRFLLGAGAALAIALNGCSHPSTEPMGTSMSVNPADGAIDVRLDTPIVLEFGAAVDRATVERSFHLVSEASMNDTLCSADPAVIGDMSQMMADFGMMEHMLSVHSISGRFQWEGDARCSFRPDAPMAPNTRHMITLGREMLEMMAGMSMMEPDGAGDGAGTLHFTTLDAASHDSHH